MKKITGRARRPIGLYLWCQGFDPEFVDDADDIEEAAAIAHAFNEAERTSPTGGRLFIEVHQKCTETLRTA